MTFGVVLLCALQLGWSVLGTLILYSSDMDCEFADDKDDEKNLLAAMVISSWILFAVGSGGGVSSSGLCAHLNLLLFPNPAQGPALHVCDPLRQAVRCELAVACRGGLNSS